MAAGYIDTHPWFVKWVVFAFVLAAVASILLGSLKLLALDEPSKSPWLIASFIAVLPLLLGFFEPAVPLFVEEEGGAAVTASVLLWATLLLLSFRLLPQIRKSTMGERAMLGILAAIVVSLTLFLAWERGLNLAEKAAMGDQIAAKRFGLLSVRANVVCLDRTERTAKPRLARKPYVYLGETGGTLVLYDYLADLANEKPTAFPLRMPSSGTIVRAAYYNPRGPRAATWVNWDCAKPKT